MLRATAFAVLLLTASRLLAGERVIDFGRYPVGQSPAGFESWLSGGGKPGEWKVIADPNLGGNPGNSGTTGGESRVLAQLSQDETDERFPMLVLDDAVYGDFTLTTRIRIVEGVQEQMAGVAFRIQDTNNYYYVRASALGGTFRFIKLVNGQRLTTIGPSVQIEKGVWYDLKVECKGNRITCALNGKELIPPLTDNTFNSGKIGFWTKSDSVSQFGETRISFTPHETLAQVLVREALQRYPRLLGLRIYSRLGGSSVPKVIASSHEDEVGLMGETVEQDVMARDTVYCGKSDKSVLVTMPLHDRNGEVAGVVRLVMQSFPGQTDQNALARARPVVKGMENRIRNSKDLFQ